MGGARREERLNKLSPAWRELPRRRGSAWARVAKRPANRGLPVCCARRGLLRMEQVLLLGDSLTQEGFKTGGWAARLADTYVRRADVLNRVSAGRRARGRLGR